MRSSFGILAVVRFGLQGCTQAVVLSHMANDVRPLATGKAIPPTERYPSLIKNFDVKLTSQLMKRIWLSDCGAGDRDEAVRRPQRCCRVWSNHRVCTVKHKKLFSHTTY
jgi:hypothetical protein